MTVKELIKILSDLEGDTKIFIRGGDSGYCDPKITEVENYLLNVNKFTQYAPHVKANQEEVVLGKNLIKGIALI